MFTFKLRIYIVLINNLCFFYHKIGANNSVSIASHRKTHRLQMRSPFP